jgi:hypothetical protein
MKFIVRLLALIVLASPIQAQSLNNYFFSFPIELPGNAELKIEVWDYDPMFSDELIGFTTIDLEDRYFSLEW